ncbi:hypothetical protein VCHA53O466_140052 [Vibrio chagasii]|nr:hypothetical protein VCHA53O466_140052 [Vibrio chagasii]
MLINRVIKQSGSNSLTIKPIPTRSFSEAQMRFIKEVIHSCKSLTLSVVNRKNHLIVITPRSSDFDEMYEYINDNIEKPLTLKQKKQQEQEAKRLSNQSKKEATQNALLDSNPTTVGKLINFFGEDVWSKANLHNQSEIVKFIKGDNKAEFLLNSTLGTVLHNNGLVVNGQYNLEAFRESVLSL